MGFYDGIEKEQAAGDLGAFVRAGHYLAMIERIRSGQTRESVDFVAVDMRILHVYSDSDTPKMIDPKTGAASDWIDDPKGLHKEGEQVCVHLLAKWPSAKRNSNPFGAN